MHFGFLVGWLWVGFSVVVWALLLEFVLRFVILILRGCIGLI